MFSMIFNHDRHLTSSYREISALWLFISVHTTALLSNITAHSSGVQPFYNYTISNHITTSMTNAHHALTIKLLANCRDRTT